MSVRDRRCTVRGEKGRAGGVQLPSGVQGTQGNVNPQHQGSPVPAPCHSCSAPACPCILPFLGIMSGFGDPKASQPHLSHGSSPRTSPSLQTSQGWGKGLAGAPHRPPSSPSAKHRTSTASEPVSNSWESLDPAVSQVVSSPSAEPWASPHEAWLWHSATLRTASPRTFPKSHLPTVPRSCLLRTDTAHPCGDQLSPKNHLGLPLPWA